MLHFVIVFRNLADVQKAIMRMENQCLLAAALAAQD
jgi:hypothetical protein